MAKKLVAFRLPNETLELLDSMTVKHTRTWVVDLAIRRLYAAVLRKKGKGLVQDIDVIRKELAELEKTVVIQRKNKESGSNA